MPKNPIKNFQENEQLEKRYRTLSLVLTSQCNLKCSYCYEKHNLRNSKIMSFNVAKEAIDYYLNLDDEYEDVVVDLFGGEPLIAYPLIKKIFLWCREMKWRKKFHFSISTNGTLLTEEMKNWFAKWNKDLTIGLSIDGNRKAHNINRDNSYDLISKHLDFIKKNWPTQPAKMTISAETIPYVADSIIELEEMGLFFTANLPLENIWGAPSHKEKLLKIYEEQLMRLVDYYVENSNLYPVYPILSNLPFYLSVPGLKMNNKKDYLRFCGAGHEMVVVDVDGSTYPCHRFLPWVSGRPAPEGLVNRQTSWKPDECNNCKIVHSCPTCAGYNWEVNGDTAIRTTFHCEAQKLEVLASAHLAARRLKKIPMSQIEHMSPKECSALNERVRYLLFLIKNGI